LAWKPAIQTEGFHGLPDSLLANVRWCFEICHAWDLLHPLIFFTQNQLTVDKDENVPLKIPNPGELAKYEKSYLDRHYQ
jgi:hypothetical protein